MRWGIIGPGSLLQRISNSFNLENDGPEIYAIASRSPERAKNAAQKYGAAMFYDSYEALVKDPQVEIVYVSTVSTTHMKCAILALEAGKPVLCEKPFASNAAEARRMVDCARANGVFLMEAMWTRYIPAVIQAKKWIDEGRIGKLRQIYADFSYCAKPDSRSYDLSAGGSSLLDVGIYGISLSCYMAGTPVKKIRALADFKGDVDDSCAILLGFDGDVIASITGGFCVQSNQEAWFLGDKGSICLPSKFWKATQALLTANTGEQLLYKHVPKAEGFEYELAEVERCVRQGLLESPLMPLDESVSIMELMDSIQQVW